MHRHAPLALLAALAAIAPPVAAQTPDTVRLRFGWEPGMQVEVEWQQARSRAAGGGEPMRMAATYRLEVSPHDEGLVVAFADTRWTEMPKVEGPAGQMFEALSRMSSGGKPEMVLTREGDFVRVEGMEKLAAEMREAMEPMLAEMDAEGLEGVRGMLENVLTEEALAASSAAQWNTVVGFWVDADLEMQQAYEVQDSMEIPMFPGMRLPMLTGFSAAERVPCTEDAAEPRCVRLVATATPDPEAFRDAMAAFMKEAGLDDEEMDEFLADLRVETETVLITEPETLRPHLLETNKTVMLGEGDDGIPVQTETETYRYRYP